MKYMIRQMQLQKVIGELNALKLTFFDSMTGNSEEWKRARKIIEGMINELKDNFG